MNDIINEYLYILKRLERGYKEDLEPLLDKIFLYTYKEEFNNFHFAVYGSRFQS